MKIRAVETIWVLGEDFVENSARRCFSQVMDQELFTHTRFDVKIFATKSFNSSFLTTVSRVRNSLANALQEVVTPLPKLLFIMLEDDVIKEVNASTNQAVQKAMRETPQDLVYIFGRSIEWLFHEVRKMIEAHNDSLPPRARRNINVIWVMPSRHMNYRNDEFRGMFGACLQNLMEIHNVRNYALQLKQNWDPYDPSIFFFDSQRYSTEGLNRLWRAFDRTVWYANVLVNKGMQKNVFDNLTKREDGGAHAGQPVRFQNRGSGRRGRGGHGYFANKRYYSRFSKKKSLPPPPTNDQYKF